MYLIFFLILSLVGWGWLPELLFYFINFFLFEKMIFIDYCFGFLFFCLGIVSIVLILNLFAHNFIVFNLIFIYGFVTSVGSCSSFYLVFFCLILFRFFETVAQLIKTLKNVEQWQSQQKLAINIKLQHWRMLYIFFFNFFREGGG